jgi:hypothetical protein
MKIPIPSGLKLPSNSEQVPFELAGKFIVIAGELVPLSFNGVNVNLPEGEFEEGQGHESAEYEDEEGHGEECGCEECGGEQKKNRGSSFMIAIETALAKKKK